MRLCILAFFMGKGGFELRSWVSNNQSINKLIKQEGRLSDHGESMERVLGYGYNKEKDSLFS